MHKLVGDVFEIVAEGVQVIFVQKTVCCVYLMGRKLVWINSSFSKLFAKSISVFARCAPAGHFCHQVLLP